MLKNAKPSEYFIGAILRAYDKSKREKEVTTCSRLWNYIVMECIHERSFEKMFEWDESKAQHINRIRTIAEVIKGKFAPGLQLAMDKKGHEIIVEVIE